MNISTRGEEPEQAPSTAEVAQEEARIPHTALDVETQDRASFTVLSNGLRHDASSAMVLLTHCRVGQCPSKFTLFPPPQNATLFGNQVFADVVSYDEVILD